MGMTVGTGADGGVVESSASSAPRTDDRSAGITPTTVSATTTASASRASPSTYECIRSMVRACDAAATSVNGLTDGACPATAA